MCQSAKTSIVAWVIAAVIALVIISSGKPTSKWNGYFILTFILVQLLEFFVWNEREREGLTSSAAEALKEGASSTRNAPSGEALTRLILIALWLQPLVQTFMAYKYGRSNYKPQLMVLTMCYLVLFLWSITQALNEDEKFDTRSFRWMRWYLQSGLSVPGWTSPVEAVQVGWLPRTGARRTRLHARFVLRIVLHDAWDIRSHVDYARRRHGHLHGQAAPFRREQFNVVLVRSLLRVPGIDHLVQSKTSQVISERSRVDNGESVQSFNSTREVFDVLFRLEFQFIFGM